MCRGEGESGGPRRCAKHMRERLEAARSSLIRATSTFAEKDAVLKERRAWVSATQNQAHMNPSSDRAAVELTKAERSLNTAHADRERAVTTRQHAARLLTRAQADYDSTRDGLHELRAQVDAEPANPTLVERYHRARKTYDEEAATREVAYGPQVPLSIADLADAGPLGQALGEVELHAWIKSAAEPDHRTGLYTHRVNLVRRDGGVRKSATIPTISDQRLTEPNKPGQVGLDGEPSMADLVIDFERQIRKVRKHTTYADFLRVEDVPNTLAERQRWRAAVAVNERLQGFLPDTSPEV